MVMLVLLICVIVILKRENWEGSKIIGQAL